MNNNVLISTSILNAFWENDKKDTLDLLLPFFKYSIAKNTKVGDKLDTIKITKFFKSEFGYDFVPSNIVKLMLNRLSPKILERKDNKYYLKVSLCDEIDKFDSKRKVYKERSSKIAVALLDFLTINYKGCSYTENNVNTALISFFVLKGICIIRDTEMLRLLKSSDDKLNYCIAQFILQEKKNDSEIFSYIVDMVKGFFISSAIYIQPNNESVSKAKFKNLCCYLDTSIVLNALGLKTNEEQIAATELLDMLKKENAVLCMFEHNFEEVSDIIKAYKLCLVDPYNNRSTHTLEFFDEYQYKSNDVERFLSLLRSKITSLGITIVGNPCYDEYLIDEQRFTEHIKNNITYRKDKALKRDVDSVSAIYRLRKRKFDRSIERCKHIFVTSNVKLVNVTNYYFKKEIKDNVPLLISDLNLSAISWLKSSSTNQNYPKNKLIENAVSSIAPSTQLMGLFFEKIDKLNAEGGISAEEAAIYRTNLFCKRELAKETQGDPDRMDEEMLNSIFDRFKESISINEKEQSELNYQKYLEQKEQASKPKRKALNEIEKEGEKAEKNAKLFYWILYWITTCIIALIGIYSIIIGIDSKAHFLFSGIFAIAIDIWGMIDLIFGKKSIADKIINRKIFMHKTRKMDKKRKEYEVLFGNLENFD